MRRRSQQHFFGRTFLLSLLLLVFGHPTFAAKVVSIHVTGNRRYSEAQIVAASGLQVGQPFDAGTLDAAAQQLGASGVFEDVEYKYSPAGADAAIQFTVAETSKLHRYSFDNFVWFSSGEIAGYVQKRVPLFGDLLPETGTVIDDVTAALQDLLAMNKIEAQAGHTQYGGLGNANWQHLFTASGPQIRIKNVQFQGAQGVDGDVLTREAAPLIGRDYSGVQCEAFGGQTFVPLYREHGYLRVEVGKPAARMIGQATGTGPYDVEVSYPVKEGLVYNWNSVQWSGNQVLSAAELDALMGMRKGVLANGKMIDAGWDQVRQGYGKRGYIDARVKTDPSYDDANLTVSFQSTIAEGPQYHMGTFLVTGVPSAAAQQIQSKWGLKPGAVYDASYFRDFASKDLPSAAASAGLRVTSVQPNVQPNREQLTVDVTLILK